MFCLKNNWVNALVAGAALVAVSGCTADTNLADYMNRSDSVTFGAGSAMEANTGIHTVRPFPRQALNTHIESDGISVVNAQTRYITPGDPDVVISRGSKSVAVKAK